MYDPISNIQDFTLLLHLVKALPFDVCFLGNILEKFHLLLFKHHFSFSSGCPHHPFFISKVKEAHYYRSGEVAVLAALQAVGSFNEERVGEGIGAKASGSHLSRKVTASRPSSPSGRLMRGRLLRRLRFS